MKKRLLTTAMARATPALATALTTTMMMIAPQAGAQEVASSALMSVQGSIESAQWTQQLPETIAGPLSLLFMAPVLLSTAIVIGLGT
ncbi:putative secreted protein [Corynebacterium deserti GIMN1.010]|uniref:Putative secreted protein n=1 Tax=Corynebacterium deserti GIMN1.010 TaxID=931089 RepID=A0A0M4CDB9_9CORY|nr:hypothetical protein [Corynebacterium deserti]ALC05478.1 putative secreted protein [Corynebacterium deserti GIMN1.010]